MHSKLALGSVVAVDVALVLALDVWVLVTVVVNVVEGEVNWQ
jgi:hypothetical protein